MRHCVNCCIQLLPGDVHEQQVSCRGGPGHRSLQQCPTCKGENKIVFRVDGKPMNLLAVLEVRAEGHESWARLLRFKRGKRCSLVFGLMIMTLVMASYILSGAHQELLISSPFHYGAFSSNPSVMDGENPSDPKQHHHQPSVNNISYVKDYPGMKLIINSITARIEFTTRQLPDIGDLKRQELHMFSVIPPKFLPNSKSPCWYEEFTGRNTTDPYLTNSYALYSKRFRSTFDALRKAFWGHLSHARGKHFRLRCLPHFYIIGQPKCGTTDLYDRLRLHPEVKFSAIKEPHWWTRKRFGIVRLRDGLRDRYPVEDYLDLFDLAAHQIHQGLQASSAREQSKMNRIIIGEASASTMWDNNAWTFFYDNSTDGEPPFLTQDFIHAFQPDVKLIVMLRDPVERCDTRIGEKTLPSALVEPTSSQTAGTAPVKRPRINQAGPPAWLCAQLFSGIASSELGCTQTISTLQVRINLPTTSMRKWPKPCSCLKTACSILRCGPASTTTPSTTPCL
ncbi:carbohydrate sulfotransferase 15 isoform X2 [Manis pentadactyla]|uniref:carbohydrate sulfotransferase 15 isoform X2 n=1 Tax=Manis pentadactyla TaxID=143292 RepID=UPI00255CA6EB|nr:carbohydrate sulfotransferase 15 isoform X2 [Manis pentadactyla]